MNIYDGPFVTTPGKLGTIKYSGFSQSLASCSIIYFLFQRLQSQQIEEYRAETQRMNRVLHGLGLETVFNPSLEEEPLENLVINLFRNKSPEKLICFYGSTRLQTQLPKASILKVHNIEL